MWRILTTPTTALFRPNSIPERSSTEFTMSVVYLDQKPNHSQGPFMTAGKYTGGQGTSTVTL